MLPQFIKKALYDHKTSIGDNPCLPPDEEETFLNHLLSSHYDKLMGGESEVDIKHLRYIIDKLNTQCSEIEKDCVIALEEMVDRCVYRIFDIPEDSINLTVKIVDSVDSSKERKLPEPTDDMEFEDIDDMARLGEEVYKRRMLNCIVAGASHSYAKQFAYYLDDLFNINDELPSLYKKLTLYNEVLLYNDEKIKLQQKHDSGKVAVNMTASNNPESDTGMVNIAAEAINAPLLLEQAVKGILELSIAHGLPEDFKRAVYVMKKSDFKLAELWDLRLGIPLWDKIVESFAKADCDIDSVGANFVLYTLSQLETRKFNKVMQNILKCTTKGKMFMQQICDNIIKHKNSDQFSDIIDKNNASMYPLNDGEEFSEAEELNEKFFTPEELMGECKTGSKVIISAAQAKMLQNC